MINVDEFTEVKNLFEHEEYTGEMKILQIEKKAKNSKNSKFSYAFIDKNICCFCRKRKQKKLPKIEIPMEAFNV
jgi:hypothetical protein